MIFVVDTSSACSALALLHPDGAVASEEIHESGRTFDLPARFRDMTAGQTVTKVAVAVGPGSFTGLRVGVSFALGLAMGLEIPIVAIKTLHLQAARSHRPAVAVAEAGRGRVYHLAPGAEPGLAEPADLPRDLPMVGWLRPATEAALLSEGLRFQPESELRSFGAAASSMLDSASEVAYGSLRLEYMQALGSAFRRDQGSASARNR
ncbi:MAG: tRNA (adenosine(37)-N6)-threonylcarbamoyltransferase complex dimerization subunit type 1 TsaB [Candidatus Dormibacteraeota bacterium]|nr:tRNA (adenosine(37)-N6)-threonylcarbamoyltransferase complex dimerization subunit type 1 TsaB [Candidatus Dormibacteraeota bacterium]